MSLKREGDYEVITYPNGAMERRHWPAGTRSAPPARALTELEIRRALTPAERAGIRAAAREDEAVADWVDYLQTAQRCGAPLSVEDAELRAGFARLRTLGVFTAARLKELEQSLLQ